MAILDASNDDNLNFGNDADVLSSQHAEGTKNMAPASDPSVDQSLVRPAESYSVG